MFPSGQLGVGDTTHRLRPEMLRHLRAAKAAKLSTGRQHSAVISPTGLLFTFGSNSSGQCGIGPEPRMQLSPMVVDRLRERRCIDVCCGSAHTLVLCESEASIVGVVSEDYSLGGKATSAQVYAMGMNSCGQVSHPAATSYDSCSISLV